MIFKNKSQLVHQASLGLHPIDAFIYLDTAGDGVLLSGTLISVSCYSAAVYQLPGVADVVGVFADVPQSVGVPRQGGVDRNADDLTPQWEAEEKKKKTFKKVERERKKSTFYFVFQLSAALT